MFDNYLPSLQGMAPTELGFVLDFAARIKNASTVFGAKKTSLIAFEDPILLGEDFAFLTLDIWKQHMQYEAQTLEGRAKCGALAIWYLSVLAMTIPELRLRGRIMWAELQRGFPYCKVFEPSEDCVKGLEPSND